MFVYCIYSCYPNLYNRDSVNNPIFSYTTNRFKKMLHCIWLFMCLIPGTCFKLPNFLNYMFMLMIFIITFIFTLVLNWSFEDIFLKILIPLFILVLIITFCRICCKWNQYQLNNN